MVYPLYLDSGELETVVEALKAHEAAGNGSVTASTMRKVKLLLRFANSHEAAGNAEDEYAKICSCQQRVEIF